jgi:hypothetical protein
VGTALVDTALVDTALVSTALVSTALVEQATMRELTTLSATCQVTARGGMSSPVGWRRSVQVALRVNTKRRFATSLKLLVCRMSSR